MKRLETLVREAHVYLDAIRYRPDPRRNGVDALEIARAIDAVARAELTLRRAFEEQS